MKLIVNQQPIFCTKDQSLLDFLRDDCRLTSVKNGCAQGACGTCSVLLNGKAVRACTKKTGALDGAHILTVEGLSPREQDVYVHAFSHCGAVQCGFCIPGMVLCAKALLDVCPAPAKEQVAAAIAGNVCRCTGYVKIERAILLAAKMLRESLPVPSTDPAQIGSNFPRIEAPAKVLGKALYAADLRLEGMVYGGAVRTPYARCRIDAIDLCAAQQHPDFIAALTAEDITGQRCIGHLKQDWPALVAIGEETHAIGDAVVLLATRCAASLPALRKLVQIKCTPLPAVTTIAQALAPDAPVLHEGGNILSHEHLRRGNAQQKIQQSKYVVTQTYVTPTTEHAFLEPECAVALPEGNGIRIYSGDQGIYQTQKECAALLGLPREQVRVTAMEVGGGFGGKEDMSVQHHAALLAHRTGLPVQFALTRDESIRVHPKRHRMEMEFTTACDEQGNLTATKAVIYADTGAYASLGGPVLQRACTHAAGPYHNQDIEIDGFAVYTNNPPAGAFRGFGVPQTCFAQECNLNRLAALVGITPYEIRRRNAIAPGETLPNGQIADESTALIETLEALRPVYESSPYAGIACALKNSGLGVGVPDVGRCNLVIDNGHVHIRTSAANIGQGVGTVLTQIVCETCNLSADQVLCDPPDTHTSPDAGNTTASRQTLFTGEAAKRAALQLSQALRTQSLHTLQGSTFIGVYEGNTDRLGVDKLHPVSHIAYSYATHVVLLDEDGKISAVHAAHDVGTAINPISLEGQIEGGVTMSLGYALTERFPLKDGVPQARFGTLDLFRAPDVPPIHTVLVGKGGSLAYGAKGIGEISSIPTAPAVALAYERWDGKSRTELPLVDTPYGKKPADKQ